MAAAAGTYIPGARPAPDGDEPQAPSSDAEVSEEEVPEPSDAGADNPWGQPAAEDASVSPPAQPAAGCEGEYSGQIWCADFEQGLPNDAHVRSHGGEVEHLTELARTGEGCMYASTHASEAMAAVVADASELDGRTVHFRGWVYLEGDQRAKHLTLYRLGSLFDPRGGIDVDLHHGNLAVYAWSHQTLAVTEERLPTDRWVCLQGRVHVAEHGSFELSLDGTRLIQTTEVDTRSPGGLRDFAAGVVWTSGHQPPVEILHDDIVLGSAAIPCD